MSKAKDARFKAFLGATEQDERDWIAFCDFEEAVDEVVDRAAMVNPIDEPEVNEREQAGMRAAVWEMLFRALPRVGLGAITASTAGLGYSIRFGLVEPKPEGLDHIRSVDDLDDLLNKAHEAEDDWMQQRERELMGRPKTIPTSDE